MRPKHRPRIRVESSDPEGTKLIHLRKRLLLRVELEEDGLRLDHFLSGRITWRSRNKVRELIDTDQIEIEGRAPRPSRKVRAGEAVYVRLPQPKREAELGEDESLDLEVLYEDRWLLAISKPAGVPVHPSGRLLHKTVITELHERYRVYADAELDVVPKLCHRLDLETSGVLLVGKDDRVVAEVGRQLAHRETVKEYLAIVHGEVALGDGEEVILDQPIGPALQSEVFLRQQVRADGAPARTGVRVEKRFTDFSLLRLRLYTGRRHQIRVHLRYWGYPIVGDKMYGLDDDFFLAYQQDRLDGRMKAELLLPRQALHAARLELCHPVEKRTLSIESPLPADLQDFLDELDESDSTGMLGRQSARSGTDSTGPGPTEDK